MKTFTILVCSMSLLIFGCSKSPKSDATILKGTWSGEEVGQRAAGAPSLVLEGSTMEFHGADPREWYKATFTLREDTTPKQLIAVVTECPFPKYVGKTANAIYQIQDGTLTLTGNEPGNPAMPTSFDAPGARKIIFKRK